MPFQHPHTIENGGGEQLTFLRLVPDPAGDWLEVENLVQPGSGPPMHVHLQQDEGLTVVRGTIGVEVLGQPATEHGAGESVTFKAGVVHRFWNAGREPLVCRGWIKPAHNLEYFLSEIYRSTRENGGKEPGKFESAYLLHRYRSEFGMPAIPAFVQAVIFPVIRAIGAVTGKYRRFADAPAPARLPDRSQHVRRTATA